LVTLLLPWAGFEYARQMESVLRDGQDKALLTTAQLLARVIAADGDLLEQSLPTTAPDSSKKWSNIICAQLPSPPLLDGSRTMAATNPIPAAQ